MDEKEGSPQHLIMWQALALLAFALLILIGLAASMIWVIPFLWLWAEASAHHWRWPSFQGLIPVMAWIVVPSLVTAVIWKARRERQLYLDRRRSVARASED